jgi:putative Holliday junction resolvase
VDAIALNKKLPEKGRIMALDIGTQRIGIAISDELRFLATPKLVLKRHGNIKDFAKIQQFGEENQIVAIVIGHPIQMDGSRTEMTEFTENFAKNFNIFLEEKTPLFLFEERLTSFEARNQDIAGLSRKKVKFIDDIAASHILQHFMDDLKS